MLLQPPSTQMTELTEMMVEGAMDMCPTYQVYRDLFPDSVIPPKERRFLKLVYPLDMSRLTGEQIKFYDRGYQVLKALLDGECMEQHTVGDDTKRGLAKQLLATILDVVNRNGTLYTAADDMAGDQAIRIGLNRADGLFVIKLGKDTSGCPFTCAICMLEGPMEGFFYFNPIVMEF